MLALGVRRVRQQADHVRVRRDDVVDADVDGVHDAATYAAPLGAVLGRAGRSARPVGGGRSTSGALDSRLPTPPIKGKATPGN